MQTNYEAEQLSMFGQDLWYGKMFPAPLVQERQRAKTSESFWRRSSALTAIPFQSLDLTPGAGNLLGEFYWELISPWRGGASTLNTGVSPKDAKESSLSQILQADPPLKYYLSPKACLGILRRAFERGKELPKKLERALKIQAGLMRPDGQPTGLEAYHINQRDEGIDLHGVSGALLATTNMQMQTFVTQPDEAVEGFDGYNGDLTGDVAATLGVNCGMSTGRNGVMAFAANQRDEVRDLHDVAGALQASPGMKQQTFVASGVVTKGNGDCFLSEERHTALTAGGGQAGQGYPCVLTAAFSAGQGSKAGGIGYQEECSPTLKAAESGTNMVPSVLCLNDQGGMRMGVSEGVSGTLRADMGGHPPIVLGSEQGGAEVAFDLCPTLTASAGMSGNNRPVLFENHSQDGRYRGPLEVAPTLQASCGMGGNNQPFCVEAPAYGISGTVIGRGPENGGNGAGVSLEVGYTLTARDRHGVCVPYQRVVGTLCSGDEKGVGNQYVSDAKCIIGPQNRVRRLTPLECERLQGFPDGWTDIPGASDTARYKALGNSVAVPCVETVLAAVQNYLRWEEKD